MNYSNIEPIYEYNFPEIEVPPSTMYGHTTRMVDAWTPTIERIHMPGFTIPKISIMARVARRSRSVLPISNSGRLLRPGTWKGGIRKIITSHLKEINIKDSYLIDFRSVESSNMAHIIQEIISHVAFFHKHIPNFLNNRSRVVIILSKNSSHLVRRTLNYLGFEFICTDNPITGDFLQLCDRDQPIKGINYHLVGALSDLNLPDYIADTPKRVFISRRFTRKIENEAEVTEILERYGFQTVYFEDIPVNLQWSISRNATNIVAIHGAGLGSLAFRSGPLTDNATSQGPTLMLTELFSAAFVVSPFRQYVASTGNQWNAVRGMITPGIVESLDVNGKIFDRAYASFRVDQDSLLAALESHCLPSQ